MVNEAEDGPAQTPDHGGRDRGGAGESAPLQSRAHFLENWDWSSVTQINRRLCERGSAQSGINRETYDPLAREWEKIQQEKLTLLDTFRWLQRCHRSAPFLFYNGNTFAEIVALLDDGRLEWLPEGSNMPMRCLPESLRRVHQSTIDN